MPVRVLLIFLFLPLNVFSEWQTYGKKDKQTKYTDYSSISYDLNEDTWRVWYMLDFGEVINFKNMLEYQSMVQQIEYNCTTISNRQAYSALMSEPMGKGDKVYEIKKPTEWIPIIPNRDNDVHSLSYQSLCIDSKKK